MAYRDRAGHAATPAALGRRIRTLAYVLPAARRRLAESSTAATCCEVINIR